jgi:hypothetical protein
MWQVTNSIANICRQTRILALNSAIEAARAGQMGKAFGVIAEEIKRFADNSAAASQESSALINDIQQKANEVIAVRTADVAYDTIDKIDRNLFERNCDVQAWATFGKIKDCLCNDSAETRQEATDLMEKLVRIYEVYYDIYLLDQQGMIVAVGVNQNLVGQKMASREWFKEGLRTKDVYVTDMYRSETIGDYTVAYSCPVRDDNGQHVGVLTTRFNWEYVYDIIDSARIGSTGDLWLVNQDGTVIGSRDRTGILSKSVFNLQAVKNAASGEPYGYTIENGKDGKPHIFGYAHTRGYNAYPGKKWSVIVSETV